MINININKFTHISYSTQGIYQGRPIKAYDPERGSGYGYSMPNWRSRERTPNGFIQDFKIYDSNCNIVPCVGDPYEYTVRDAYTATREFPQLSVGTGGLDNPIIVGGLLVGGNILYDRINYYAYNTSTGTFQDNTLSVQITSRAILPYHNDELISSCRVEASTNTLEDMGVDLGFGVKIGFYNPICLNLNSGVAFFNRWYANTEGSTIRSVWTPQSFFYRGDDDYPNGHIAVRIGFFVKRYYESNMLYWGSAAGDYIVPVACRSFDNTGYYFMGSYYPPPERGNYNYPIYAVNFPFISIDEYTAAKCLLGFSRGY